MKQQILPQKMKHKLQKVDIDQLQDQRKKKKNQIIGLAGRVNRNTEVFSESPGGTFKLPLPNLMQSLHHQEPSY